MAWLSPIANCKIADVNAFLTGLTPNTNLSNTLSIPKGVGAFKRANFTRTEQLTKAVFYLIGPQSSVQNNDVTICLGQDKTATMTIASPCVVTITTHGYANGDAVRFATTGALPTGLLRGTEYFVGNVATSTFNLYDTQANALAGGATGRIDTSGTQSGTHTCVKCFETKTYTSMDIYGELNTSQTGPKIFHVTTGWTTTVDATANKWGFFFYSPSTYGGNDWAVGTGTDSSLSIWGFGTTAATAVSGADAIMFDKQVDMTTGFTLKTHQVGTAIGVCGIIPAKVTGDPFLEPQLLVDPTKATPATLTIDGMFLYACLSSMAFGKPIRFTTTLASGATSATLVSNFDGTSGTYLVHLMPLNNSDNFAQVNMTFTNGSTNVTCSALPSNFIADAGVCITGNYKVYLGNGTGSFGTGGTIFGNTSVNYLKTSLMFFGEVTRKMYAVIKADSAIGVNTITVEGGTNWKANDKIIISGTSGVTADSTQYVVSSVAPSGGNDVVTLTTNLATANRKIGGYVRLSYAVDGAITFQEQTAGFITASFIRAESSVIRYIAGLLNVKIDSGTIINPTSPYLKKIYIYGCNNIPILHINRLGSRCENLTASGISTDLFSSKIDVSANQLKETVLFKNLYGYGVTGGSAPFSTNIGAGYWENVFITTDANFGTAISGTKDIFVKNLRVWVVGILRASYVTNMYSDNISGIYIDNAVIGCEIGTSAYAKLKNMYMGTFSPNTTDFVITSGAFTDIELNNVSNFTLDRTNQKSMVTGTNIKFTDRNGVKNETLIIQKFGDITVSGAGLSDTTVHNGNQALRFRSLSVLGRTEWEQVVPTGNIQNKDMMIGIWVNVNNSAYWAGTYEMPRLTITYDDGTIAYAQAGQVTGWQYIFVPFTPTTTFASVKAKLTTMTNATTTNADVYFADYSVLYPAGYTLNLGAFNNLTAGFPTVPTISTSVSALDVWSADPTQFGASTVGDKVNKIKTDTSTTLPVKINNAGLIRRN